MGTFIKVTDYKFGKLNNAETRAFFNRFLKLMNPAPGAGGGDTESPDEIGVDDLHPLGFPVSLKQSLTADLGLLTDNVQQQKAAEETPQMAAVDARRDSLFSYLYNLIRQMTKSPIEAESAAATRLELAIRPYAGAGSLPSQQETSNLEGLITDLAKDPLPGCIDTLRLSATVEQLIAANREYDTLSNQRMLAMASSRTENSKTIRERMVTTYEDMADYVFANNLLTPTPERKAFIANTNALLAETDALYNQRVAQARAAAAKKEPDSAEPETGQTPAPEA